MLNGSRLPDITEKTLKDIPPMSTNQLSKDADMLGNNNLNEPETQK